MCLISGLQVGFYPSSEQFAESWSLERRFSPSLEAGERERKYAGWKEAVRPP